MTDPKNGWISELVPGKSFIDVGGLWGTVNEKVSVALKAGAAKATMSDIAPLNHPLWTAFDEHCSKLGVKGYQRASFDLTLPHPETIVGQHDIVHCSGIIYHVPDPWGMLRNLWAITREYAVLTSMVVPERIHNAKGLLTFPRDTALFVPSLLPETKAVIAEHFDALEIELVAINSEKSEPWILPNGQANFGPWWWLWSPAFLAQLVQTSGFKVLDQGWSWQDRSYSYLLEKN